jgi:Winged helix-turn helix
MVLLREEGLAHPAIGSAMGVSLSTVNRAHMAYDQGGIKALKPKPCGGRQRQNMTIAEEKTPLARFANAAGAGELLNIHDLKHAYEQAIGHVAQELHERNPRIELCGNELSVDGHRHASHEILRGRSRSRCGMGPPLPPGRLARVLH